MFTGKIMKIRMKRKQQENKLGEFFTVLLSFEPFIVSMFSSSND